MTHETLQSQVELTPLESYSNLQNAIIEKVHSFQGGRPGDTYFGTMKIYREPEAFKLLMLDGNSVITLGQTRCETSDLGVISRITLKHEMTTKNEARKTVYRNNETNAVKEEVSGDGSVVSEMNQEDFNNAVNLLNKIRLSVKLL